MRDAVAGKKGWSGGRKLLQRNMASPGCSSGTKRQADIRLPIITGPSGG
jgi:hypothetical protein